MIWLKSGYLTLNNNHPLTPKGKDYCISFFFPPFFRFSKTMKSLARLDLHDGSTYFLQTEYKEDGKSGFKLTLINGLDVWKGHGKIVLVHSVM